MKRKMQVKLNADVAQSLLTCDWLKNCSKAQRGACLFGEDKSNMEKIQADQFEEIGERLTLGEEKGFQKG